MAALGGFALITGVIQFFFDVSLYIRMIFDTRRVLPRSSEPELSITRVKDLEQFICEYQTFMMDSGHVLGVLGDKFDNELNRFRDRFEELLGHSNG